MQKVSEIVNKRISRLSANDELSESMKGEHLTREEREALAEAERLAEYYADVVPNFTTISDNYLFRLSNEKMKKILDE